MTPLPTRLVAILSVVAMAASAQAQPPATAYKAPRNSLGQPDLEGAWTNETLTRLERRPELAERRAMTEAEVAALEQPGVQRKLMRVAGEPRTSLLTFPADGRVPPLKTGAVPDPRPWVLPPGGAVTDNPETQAIDDQCLLAVGNLAGPVMLPLPNNSNYAIVQTRDTVAILVEMIHDVRLVRIGGTHRTDGIRPWLGDSIGHYEGDTLVVETTNFPQAQPLRGAWKELKVTERFTRVAPDRLLYRFTAEAPNMWAQPWGGEYEFAAIPGPIEEYACHEGEVSVEHMLDAARAAEREKSGKP